MYQYAETIRRLRKEAGLTQSSLSDKIRVSVKTIYRYEHGQVKRYNPVTVGKFAEFFGVEDSDIWKENDYETAE